MKNLLFSVVCALALMACAETKTTDKTVEEASATADSLVLPGEKHLKNVRQLTFGGDNAEAYFSFDSKSLTLQRTAPSADIPCDQIFAGKLPETSAETFDLQRISNGKGRTTCSFFMPGDQQIIFASTHDASGDCPPEVDRAKMQKYVWPIYNSYELYIADLQGNILQRMTENDAYDAEATVSPDGTKIVFTSTRNGDLDLYIMDIDGSNVVQVTKELGYDGGAFFSPDGKQLIFRASRFETEAEKQEYKDLLTQGFVAPTNMELFICNLDGTGLQQITSLGKANWAPFFHPSGEKIIFSSNHASETGRSFNLYMINRDGSGLEQVTFDPEFASFPMFSYDGKKLVFAANRNNGGTRETNLFIADWVE
ncbi:MAG: hypothetical protein SF052_08525 [Bacteroidia bacterium]|nr:hypothetical protein [Bacteroidia bacterium]